MTSIQVIIQRDQATPALAARLAKAEPRRLANIVGPHLKTVVQDHLLANGKNKRGWPTTNFWARAAKNTRWSADDAGNVAIKIDQVGVRQRFYGGPITAGRTAQMLTIPISPEAYGKRASEFPGAFLLKTKKGVYIVQRGETITANGAVKSRTGAKKRGLGESRVKASLEFLFKLKKSVMQEEDRTVIPQAMTLRQEALLRLEEALK